jgi:hypothetical protein
MNRRDFIMAMLATAAGPLLPEAASGYACGNGVTDALEEDLLGSVFGNAVPKKLFIALFDGEEVVTRKKRITFEDMENSEVRWPTITHPVRVNKARVFDQDNNELFWFDLDERFLQDGDTPHILKGDLEVEIR